MDKNSKMTKGSGPLGMITRVTQPWVGDNWNGRSSRGMRCVVLRAATNTAALVHANNLIDVSFPLKRDQPAIPDSTNLTYKTRGLEWDRGQVAMDARVWYLQDEYPHSPKSTPESNLHLKVVLVPGLPQILVHSFLILSLNVLQFWPSDYVNSRAIKYITFIFTAHHK